MIFNEYVNSCLPFISSRQELFQPKIGIHLAALCARISFFLAFQALQILRQNSPLVSDSVFVKVNSTKKITNLTSYLSKNHSQHGWKLHGISKLHQEICPKIPVPRGNQFSSSNYELQLIFLKMSKLLPRSYFQNFQVIPVALRQEKVDSLSIIQMSCQSSDFMKINNYTFKWFCSAETRGGGLYSRLQLQQ